MGSDPKTEAGPGCSTCGVPIAEHPDTDICAIEEEAARLEWIEAERLARLGQREDAPLDAAWREAEAALPDRFQIERLHTQDGHVWEVDAIGPDDGWLHGSGSTPAAALQALAARLRESKP